MKKNIGILHLSDIHACTENKRSLSDLVELLKTDLDKIAEESQTEIHAICITGDLINAGDNIDTEMDVALDTIIHPIMQHLNLSEERIFVVPGNHEVKRSLINKYMEAGLLEELKSAENIDRYLNSGDVDARKRIADFEEYATLFGGTPVFEDGFCRAYKCCVGEHEIGIACLNSAWRSAGVGLTEKGKMIVGTKQIIDTYAAIKDTQIKICLMHHPLDWLLDCDKTAVEKCIHQFDVVLNGHIHESSSKVYTTFNGHALFNTCGKLDNSSDIYNGYSLVSINPYNMQCTVQLRQYFTYPRNCYDRAINLCENGVFSAKLGDTNNVLGLAYDVAHSIKRGFSEYADRYFVSNVAAGRIVQTLDEAFIPPLFSDHSEYEKETAFDPDQTDDGTNEEDVKIEEICRGTDNLLLLGRKECGKTTTIHYLTKYLISNFNELKKVPIVIDCQFVNFSGKDVILRAAMNFINEYCSPGDSFSQEEVRALLQAGLCTIMFDEFDTVQSRHLDKIYAFLHEYSNNRFIFCEKEVIGASEIVDIPIKPDCEYKKYHMCLLTKKQIRAVAQKVIALDQTDEKYAMVDRIMQCFKNAALPKTPFVLSVILSLCDSMDFSQINEAVVLEQFMELLLGKHSPKEAATSTFDYRAKEDFLIAIVTEMLYKNRFYLSYQEFSDFVAEYHTQRGFDLVESQFDKVFFMNSVLVRIDQIVRFRYNCMIEYYIAQKASQEPEFLNSILENGNYIHYTNELRYYTGLNRRSLNVLKVVQADLQKYYEEIGVVTNELENYKIDVEFSIPEDIFTSEISKGRLTQEESDRLSDIPQTAEIESPVGIDKLTDVDKSRAFLDTFFAFGTCIKNLEFIDREEKDAAYDDYLKGLSIILAIMKHAAEEKCEKRLLEMRSTPEKYTEKDIRKTESISKDFIKIALPIGIQNIALENVGTIKLKTTFESRMISSDVDSFSRFFSTFILCDLRVKGVGDILRRYVADVKDKSLLKIIFFKLLYYYQFRYFSRNLDVVLENSLADINLKLSGKAKFSKSATIKQIKDQRISEKDIK